MFFEFRMYRSQPGQRDALADFMDKVVIPFQASRGMVVVGSFVSLDEDDLYIWMRRFDSEAQREALYKAVYEDPEWTDVISPKIGTLLDRSKIKVLRIDSTAKSVIR